MASWGTGVKKDGLQPGNFRFPVAVAICDNADVIVVEGSGRVQKLTASGKNIWVSGTKGPELGQFHNPSGVIVMSPLLCLAVTDCRNHRVQILSLTDGTFVSSFGDLYGPYGITMAGASRELFVTEWDGDRVSVWQY